MVILDLIGSRLLLLILCIQTRGINFHRSTRRTAPIFTLSICPCPNNIRTQQSNTKQKWCDGTYHFVILIKYMPSHLIDAQESTCWLWLLEFKQAEGCMALSSVVSSIKPERCVNLLLKNQQWTLELKELKCCDTQKINGQRNPMTINKGQDKSDAQRWARYETPWWSQWPETSAIWTTTIMTMTGNKLIWTFVETPMIRDWRPSPRRSRFDLLVATS